jgi:hypothetical protein
MTSEISHSGLFWQSQRWCFAALCAFFQNFPEKSKTTPHKTLRQMR